MAVEIVLSDTNGTIGEIVDYSVTEDATPVVVGDSSGSVGQISVNAKAIVSGPIGQRSGGVVGASVELIDTDQIDGSPHTGRGSIQGTVTQASLPGERVSLSAETILNRLNTDRKAKPFYGVYTPERTTVTTRTNLMTNPDREVNLAGISVDTGAGGNTGNATLTRATEDGYVGYFARSTYTSNGAAVGGGITEVVNLAGGSSYTFSGRYRVSRTTPPATGLSAQTVRFIMRYYTSADVALTTFETLRNVANGEWAEFSVSGTAPGNAAYARIFFTAGGTAGTLWKIGDTIDSDKILVEAGTGGSYFDGSMPTTTTTDEAGVKTTLTQVWLGTPHASASTQTVSVTVPGSGYDATEASAFRYYCGLVDIYNVNVSPDFEGRPVAYRHWEGNVWKYIKDFAAAVGGEVALVNGTVTLRKARTIDIPLESIVGPTIAVSSVNSAQFVEVTNQNSRWATDEVAIRSNTLYTVEADGYTDATVTVDHSVTSVNSPVAVTTYNESYEAGLGQYSVVDSQGLAVDPDWWTRSGGRIVTSVVQDTYDQIQIQIFGPQVSSTTYIGPFRIGRSAGPNTFVAALDITASGVFINKQVKRIRTGVSPDQTSNVTATAIDNLFLTNADTTYTRGLDAACMAAGPVVTLTGSINPYVASGQQFGTLVGGRVRYGGNIFRITNTRSTRGGVSVTAVADMTFADMNDLYAYTFADFDQAYASLTFGAFDNLYPNITFEEFDSLLPSPTFGDFDEIFEGASFGDHAIYPYTTKEQA